ncbi:MAG: class I SAM-dependent methyltransferase [Candidatus Aenigmatarchaeota archaeon]
MKGEIRAEIEKIRRLNDYRNSNLYFERIRPMIKKDSVIVDAMCGTAFLSFLLYKKGYKNITGFDISPCIVGYTRELFKESGFNKARFFAGDVNKIKIRDGFADFVFILASLHHLISTDIAVKELKRILKPGGRLVVIEPNAINPLGYYLHKMEEKNGRTSANERMLTPFSVRRAFKDAGFSSVTVSTFRFLPSGKLAHLERILEKVPLINMFGYKIIAVCRR